MTTAIDKIHEFDRFGSILGLERMNELLDKLGNPQKELKVIHVAGTNGKGSVCKFLDRGLAACGYKTALYTSPFIERFNERIQLGSEQISDEDLELYTAKVLKFAQQMVDEGLDSPTEFEVVTAIALLYFKEKNADICILEVGLGGSGDSTNVVDEPLACAIASISYDHMDRLGNTLEEIAADKAGIIKDNVPIIANVKQHGPAAVIARKAYEKNARLYDISGLDFSIADESPAGQTVSMEIFGTDYSDVAISMTGRHQAENLKTALAVIEVLRKQEKIKMERSRLYAGLKEALQPGRFEIIAGPGENDQMDIDEGRYVMDGEAQTPNRGQAPVVILDGAHNEAGAAALEDTMKKFYGGKKILLVTGILKDKQVDEILNHLLNITDNVIATEPDNPRKLDKEALAEAIADKGINVKAKLSPGESIELVQSMRKGGEYDVVLFAGSLYLIGEIRRALKDGKEEE